jgi:hypothetical protein
VDSTILFNRHRNTNDKTISNNASLQCNPLKQIDVTTYKVGTLRLSLVDSDTKNIFWKGRASNSIYKSENESKAIAKFVDDMFAKFPKNR